MEPATSLPHDAFAAALALAKQQLQTAEARVQSVANEQQAAKSEVVRLRQLIELLSAQLGRIDTVNKISSGPTASLTEGLESPRASAVYNNVVRLFGQNRGKEFTVDDLSARLETNNGSGNSKTIHNVIGYLLRQGKLRRVSRGRYYWPEYGVGVEMDEM